MRIGKWLQVSIVCGLAASGASNAQTEVSFRTQFALGALGSTVVIQTMQKQTLVIEPGEYDLNGKSIVIRAAKVILLGDAVIRSFTDDSEAPLKTGTGTSKPQADGVKPAGCTGDSKEEGCDGSDGEEGSPGAIPANSGKRAGNFLLNVQQFTPQGFKLDIKAHGQRGGQGQTGGSGQQGANGTEGRGQGGMPSCSGPWRGGNGGIGGAAGRGGIGGDGGSGGIVRITPVLKSALDSNIGLQVSVRGGDFGRPGSPGLPGAGGGPGKTGPRTSGCPGPQPGPAANGTVGGATPISTTPVGQSGLAGKIEVLN